jgi:hypothetical protein
MEVTHSSIAFVVSFQACISNSVGLFDFSIVISLLFSIFGLISSFVKISDNFIMVMVSSKISISFSQFMFVFS